MNIKPLVIKSENSNIEVEFNKQINFVNDISLSKVLGKENIKNQDSQYIIKSLDNTPIYDVIQIKVNVQKVGTFLVNLKKDSFNEEDRKTLIDKISTLKSEEEVTVESQKTKIINLLKLVDDYDPIYVSFSNVGELIINLSEIEFSSKSGFPILILKNINKNYDLIEKLKKYKFFNKKYLVSEYFFLTIFSILFSFGITCGIHNSLNSDTMSILMFVLSIFFLGVESYIYISNQKEKPEDKKLKYALFSYSISGIIVGLPVGLIVSKNVLTKNEQIYYGTTVFWLSLLISISLLILVLIISTLIYKLIEKNKKAK